ncbi:signal peptide peptidase SppA [Lipingzhangella sp. LS1_29]|uniref:Signal peptide peptidase SppA n=1 Tax=Lipingzhangella rawalii TaxID=2055835 RepID=A0ABU2HBQ9_9ACTN|nr:signal peptide peptidase SppA [Lipingzhangella rawalii]MDS1272029.1 signal peptide peptidase SppA [Lipingzhangella rawalii]
MVDVAKLIESVSGLRQRRATPLVLELDLTEGVVEETPQDPISQLKAMRRVRLNDTLDGIRAGAADPRVSALVVKVGGQPIGMAVVQELRAALEEFTATGKPVIAWTESFGDFGPGNLPYYLAAACTEIVLQPSGGVGLTGLRVVNPFFRDALDRLGVEYEAATRYEYKSGPNQMTERGFTEAHREATGRILESLTEQIVHGIAEGRGLDRERVRALIDRGPFMAEEALSEGLIDRTAYRDEIYSDIMERFRRTPQHNGDRGETLTPQLQYVGRYQRNRALHSLPGQVRAVRRGADHIALISGTGPILSGRTRRSPVGGGTTMGADSIAAAFRAARRDPHVRAVVFRVNSPGGSHVASDTILREVRLTSSAGIPVVVSMGEVAGSGGYFVALGADVIVAQPSTLTGSIGVYIAKPVLTDLLGKIGVNTESIEEGEHAGMFSLDHRFTEAEWEHVNARLDHVYTDFTSKVAEGRGMSVERVHELARGRVWTGQDACDNGLVDRLGGIDTAAAVAREQAGLPQRAELRAYPRLNPLERLVPPESSEDRSAALTQLRLSAWGPLASASARLGLPATGPLTMPGVWDIQ